MGYGRHGIQTRCNGAKNLERGRMKCTGTPMLGLPPVPSGDVAFFDTCLEIPVVGFPLTASSQTLAGQQEGIHVASQVR